MRADPKAMARLGSRLRDGSIVISATNGKTTTAAMAASILRSAQRRVVHNGAGANMAGGIATALLDAHGRRGAMRGDLGLFEVDEFWVDRVARDLRPRLLAFGNLFRDQLDRYGELETIADRWAALLHETGADHGLVLNADDPLIADLGRDRDGVLYFGVEDDGVALPLLAHASDSKHCRRCGTPYVYDAVYMAHLGRYHCPNCGAARPRPAVSARAIELQGMRGSTFTLAHADRSARVTLGLPGVYNVYNALCAAAIGLALGVDLGAVADALAGVRASFGRAELVSTQGRELFITLVKNPAGANEVLRTLAHERGEHDLLAVLNDATADGRDVSWVWDADFEALAPRLRRVTAAGTRAPEMALRLKYAGVASERIRVETALDRALDAALADVPASPAPLYALPTYTAMLELRELLARRGEVASSWR